MQKGAAVTLQRLRDRQGARLSDMADDDFDAEKFIRDLQRPTIVLTATGHAYSVRFAAAGAATAEQIFDPARYQTEVEGPLNAADTEPHVWLATYDGDLIAAIDEEDEHRSEAQVALDAWRDWLRSEGRL